MPDNTWWSTKICVKFLSDLVIFSIFSYDIPLDFHELIPVVPLKYFIYFLDAINTKFFWKITEEKHFSTLKILNLFIKSLVSPFVNIAWTFL